MTALDLQLFGFPGFRVQRDLRRRDAGGRFDDDPRHDRIAVGDPAGNSSGVVRGRGSVRRNDRVVVLAAAHPGRFESGAEFHAFDGRDREEQVADDALRRIEKRFAERVRYAGGRAFDDTAHRILRTQRGFDDFREIVRVVAVVDLKDRICCLRR